MLRRKLHLFARRALARRSMLAVAGLALLSAAGCATLGMLGRFVEPVVTFKDLRLTGLGLQGGSLDIVLSVYNPNQFNIEGVRLTYQLNVDNVRFGEGALDSRFVVPKGDSTDIRIPLNFTYAGIGAAGRQVVDQGAVNYTVGGDLTVDTPLGNFTRPYSRDARFTVFGGTTR
jgi:LEA14-like dessication related protein